MKPTKQERKQGVWVEYVRKRQALLDEYKRTIKEIDAEEDGDAGVVEGLNGEDSEDR